MTGLITLDRARPVRKDAVDLRILGAVVDELLGFATHQVAKAQLPSGVRARNELLAELVEPFREELFAWFRGILSRAAITKADSIDVSEDDVDWPAERRKLRALLDSWYAKLGAGAYRILGGQLGIEIAFDLEGPATAGIRDALAAKVVGITDTARSLIGDYVTTAIDRGYSVNELVDGVADDSFLGLEAIFGQRADTIARTETAVGYNLAASAGYRESGLVDEVLVFDGPECGWTEHDDPDLADGSTRSLDDADEYPTSHPNCQRAFGPIAAGEGDS